MRLLRYTLASLKDEIVFLYAQSAQASADNVTIRRFVVVGGDSIDVV